MRYGSNTKAKPFKNAAFLPAPWLLSELERRFFRSLAESIPEGYFVAPKVRLADLVRVNPVFDETLRLTLFRRISQKHLDFVLVEEKTGKVVAAIELDDSTHDGRRKGRDDIKDKVLLTARIPLIRVKPGLYEPDELSRLVSEFLPPA